jgi:hypothetical protein
MKSLKKIWRSKKYLLIFCLLAFVASSIAFIQYQQNDYIKGTWISHKDPKNKWIFTSDKAKSYYNGKRLDTFTYKISKSSPECGEKVTTGSKYEYLHLTNVKDNADEHCYQIDGLTDSTLTLRPLGHYTILFFEKKK